MPVKITLYISTHTAILDPINNPQLLLQYTFQDTLSYKFTSLQFL